MSVAQSVLATVGAGDSPGERFTSLTESAYSIGSQQVDKDPLAEFDTSKGPVHVAANASLVIGILVLGIVAIVGILIFASVSDATEDHVNGTELEAPRDDLTNFFGESMSLIGIAMIVGVAALIIGLVAGLGGRDATSGLR